VRSLLDDELLYILNNAMILKLDTHFIELIQHEIYRRKLKIEFSFIEEKFKY
jgi:hypothetical protein